jgi:hypothetical protein
MSQKRLSLSLRRADYAKRGKNKDRERIEEV